MKSMTRKTYSVWMMAVMFVLGLGAQAHAAPAGMVSTQQLAQQSQLDSQRASISQFLARDDVRHQLMARGVDSSAAEARVHNMTAAELSMLSAQIDELPAGEGALETVLFLLVIFMLLDIAGVTDIFPGL
ncbi:MAG: PA2779 family protein [Pseudohongiella sp.]|uniref:PA2779 family protein n=1 Tax=Pseudohongiella sp. TaxID=1979412 RepID=UPI0034A05C75